MRRDATPRGAPMTLEAPHVAMDSRMLFVRQGAGVATYAANLKDSIEAAGFRSGLLTDAGGQRRHGPLGRFARVLTPQARTTSAVPRTALPAGFSVGWTSPAVLRQAQLHTRLPHQPLHLHSPRPAAVMPRTY